VEKFNYAYADHQVLFDVDLNFHREDITALIGPSGCGKSTLLRSINRINDLVETARVMSGSIKIDGVDLYSPEVDVISLRRNVGMVFQKYNPFPRSIFENAVYGLRVAGVKDKHELAEAAERSLRLAALWDEVKDRLHESAIGLSGGQQQRLCIARAVALQPRILLMDEPCAALDPIATARIENLIAQLRGQFTFVIVTHNMEQAKRIADKTAFFYKGKVIECDDTMTIFGNPGNKLTESYITGRLT
jgi:phosphate transport system ATP-binding protein